ncbi:MAG TPA: hypothetical protein VGO92_12960, partial [Acidimicrobiales bacterium]|nr:hypothetical protein [Acidimicrobiales bacterium]
MRAIRVLAGVLLVAGLAVVVPGPAKGFFPYQPETYFVGAAARDITPAGQTRLGGFGLGDGSVLPSVVVGPGHVGSPGSQRIGVRALVVDDGGGSPVVIADIETQGMFAAYKGGAYGLSDIAAAVSAARPGSGLQPDHMILASDHTHSGPDTIGAWGFVPDSYMERIKQAAVEAVVAAYDSRVESTMWVGRSKAFDLVYNQNCTQALNQDPDAVYTGPEVCNLPDQDVKDAYVRVLQARAVADGSPVATLVSYNAHSTLGGADGIHGDWPQFLSDRMAAELGGVGIGMEGAIGRIQPCRPQCSFTNPAQFGGATDRRSAYLNALMSHVRASLDSAVRVTGVVTGTQRLIREPVTDPAVLALFAGGSRVGAELRRSLASPWMAGPTIGTPVSSIAIGRVLVSGYPGEAYPNIDVGVAEAVSGLLENIPLGLANDQ